MVTTYTWVEKLAIFYKYIGNCIIRGHTVVNMEQYGQSYVIKLTVKLLMTPLSWTVSHERCASALSLCC